MMYLKEEYKPDDLLDYTLVNIYEINMESDIYKTVIINSNVLKPAIKRKLYVDIITHMSYINDIRKYENNRHFSILTNEQYEEELFIYTI